VTLFWSVVVGLVGAVALFVIVAKVLPAGEQIAPPLRDDPIWRLPVGQSIAAEDVESVRLPVALRGYRFAEVDELLDALAAQLRDRDREIARLKGTPVRHDAAD